MKSRRESASAAVLPALLFVLTFLATPAPAVAVVSVQSASVNAGQTFSIDVEISNVTDLVAFQFDLGFNPTLLAATTASEGSFLPGGGATFFIAGSIDNVVGSVAATADTLLSTVSGVAGSGTLATFVFTALAQGTGTIDLSDLILLDSTLSAISAATVSASVIVREVPSSVPEPSTWLLFSGGLIGFAVSIRSTNRPRRSGKIRY